MTSFKFLLLILASLLLALPVVSAGCYGIDDKNSRSYKRKVANFLKKVYQNKPTMTNLIRVSNESNMTPEELISVIDKNESCDFDEAEMITFIEKWASKRNE